ncbi:MAG: hypothetical protein R3251_02945 [Candidatus Spechtbacterales bacterium]|nr:hypothetical protein [Candidatus Spechtbacterales bacterium]
MKQKIKIFLIAFFTIASLAILILSAYFLINPSEQPPEQGGVEIGESPPSVISFPTDTAENFGKKGNESQDAKNLKENLISKLEGGSGTIYEESGYRVDYVQAADTFSIEILNPDYGTVKNLAFQWFKEKGFSDTDICEMKILFYLSRGVKTYYEQQGEALDFNPLFENCNE